MISVACEPANPPVVESLLRSLPAWFSIEDAIVEYVTAAARLRAYVARDGEDTPLGVLLVERHFPGAAEVFLMAVDHAHHRPVLAARWSVLPRTTSPPTASACCR